MPPATPLNVTVPAPGGEQPGPPTQPKFVPLMLINAPTGPTAGEILLMAGVTVKLLPLLRRPATVTITLYGPGPALRLGGTKTVTFVFDQLRTPAAKPPNVTVLVP